MLPGHAKHFLGEAGGGEWTGHTHKKLPIVCGAIPQIAPSAPWARAPMPSGTQPGNLSRCHWPSPAYCVKDEGLLILLTWFCTGWLQLTDCPIPRHLSMKNTNLLIPSPLSAPTTYCPAIAITPSIWTCYQICTCDPAEAPPLLPQTDRTSWTLQLCDTRDFCPIIHTHQNTDRTSWTLQLCDTRDFCPIIHTPGKGSGSTPARLTNLNKSTWTLDHLLVLKYL